MSGSLVAATLGGTLIGLSAAVMLHFEGRIAGISGIVGGAFRSLPGDSAWRVLFVAGLVVGGLLLSGFAPAALVAPVGRGTATLAVAGLLVGFGTRLGSGCTSGHGVCGISRGSTRSIVATLVFISAGFVTVTLTRILGVFG